MKRLMAKIWVPTLLVLVAAVQSFGIDTARAISFRKQLDSLEFNRLDDSIVAAPVAVDSFVLEQLNDSTVVTDTTRIDSLVTDTTAVDTLILAARDTIKVPEELRETDPFKFKYYIAIKDSITRVQVRDSLLQAGDTVEVQRLDSLYIKDSTEVAIAEFNAWYASLSRMERKKYDAEQALPGLIAAANRKLEIKDSIRARKDSIVQNTPRILSTFAIPDSMHYKRIITWNADRKINDIKNLRVQVEDTSYNRNFYDYPFLKEDINASWLGVSGSPVQYYDFFKRREEDNAIFYTPYESWSFSPETLPQFNTKTPYTELCYWGTLFANSEKEESNIRVLTTQNITPKLNLLINYHNYKGNGMLKREDTGNRTFSTSANYLGEKYIMHTGFIYNRIERSENGGLVDPSMIRDTIVDAREIDVYLREAANKMRKRTLFLDQSYRIPFTFLDKEVRAQRKAEKLEMARRDSIQARRDSLLARRDSLLARKDSVLASGDSIAIAAYLAAEKAIAEIPADTENETEMAAKTEIAADTLMTDVTTAFIGHSSEWTVFKKKYTDNITDEAGKEFYHDRFYLNPATSADSLRVMRFENRAFLRLQPWSDDAIVSKIDVGIGDKLLSHYSFSPTSYLTGPVNIIQNSVYLYAGAKGQYKNYFTWNAGGDYTFAGAEINDFGIDGNITANFFPFRRAKNSPLTLKGHFETSLREPDYYEQHIYTNHYKWDNDFSKISKTKVEASVSVPKWKLAASFGYALLDNNIYYDTLGIVRQNTAPMSVMTAELKKDFKLGNFHFDHKAMFQLSSNEEVMPLPMLALNFRYYLQFDVVKNVMQMQIGANAWYTTKWYAPAYNPVIGVFHNQNKEEYGNCPYVDAFVNVQWKRVSLFVKAVNVNMGWPLKKADYFTAAGYIATQRTVKFGITWPFWTLPGKNKSSSSSASTSGGNRGGSGLPSGLSAGGGRQGAKNFR